MAAVLVAMVMCSIGAVTQIINASLCSDQQLECDNSTVDNPNPQYQWSKGNDTVTSGSSLNLTNIKVTDFGLYYCWLMSSPYGSVVTKVLLQQGKWLYREIFVNQICFVCVTGVPLISNYVFLLIHQNHPHVVSKGIF